jgi:hypothetical protein
VSLVYSKQKRPALKVEDSRVEMFNRGHVVVEADIQDEAWYVEDWTTHMMRL